MAIVAEDVRFSMPPLREWFEVSRPLRTSSNRPSFREPGLTASNSALVGVTANRHSPSMSPVLTDPSMPAGLQILEIGERQGRLVVTDIVSYRVPDLAVRCGLPARIEQ